MAVPRQSSERRAVDATLPRRATLRPGRFFALTFAWTWLFWGVAVLTERPWSSGVVLVLFAVGGVGPVLAAGVLLRLSGDREVERDFWRRVVDVRRVPGRWWAVVLVLALLSPVAGRLASGEEGAWLAPGAVTVLVVAVVAGLVEEPGWRGYALEGLTQRHHPLVAAAAVGVAWPLWHLPLFFLEGSYQSDLGVGSASFWLFLGNLCLLSFVYAWVYLATKGSILAVVVLHALANAAGEIVAVEGEAVVELLVTAALALPAVAFLSWHAERGERTHQVPIRPV